MKLLLSLVAILLVFATSGLAQVKKGDDTDFEAGFNYRSWLKPAAADVWSDYASFDCYPKLTYRAMRRSPGVDDMPFPGVKKDTYSWRIEFTNTFEDPIFFDYEIREDSTLLAPVKRKGRMALGTDARKATRSIQAELKTDRGVYVFIKQVRFIEDSKDHPYADCVK